MTQQDKQRMLDRLLVGVPTGSFAHQELEKMLLKDLDAIEPIFDAILERELKTCVAIFVSVISPDQRQDISRRLHERAAQSLTH